MRTWVRGVGVLAVECVGHLNAALAVFDEFGDHLGQAMKAVLYAADPEVVILGGSVSKSYALFKDVMWKAMQDFAYSITIRKIKIEVSETENIAVLGAAALYLDALAQ